MQSRLDGRYFLDGYKVSVAEIASFLRSKVDYPVLDHTGLTGLYELSIPIPEVRLARAAQQDSVAPAASDPSGVDIFKSVEMLGLHLEKGKASIENLVVEHVEKVPTEN